MQALSKRFLSMQALQAAVIINMLEVDIILNADQAHKALMKSAGFKFSGVRKIDEWTRRRQIANTVCGFLRTNHQADFIEFAKGGQVSEVTAQKIANKYGINALKDTDALLCAVQDSQRY
jgi:hypothetical protein